MADIAIHKTRRGLILALIGAVIAAGGGWAIYAKRFANHVVTAPVERRTLQDKVDVSGAVESQRAVILKAEAAGPIKAVLVEEGLRQANGTPLLTIDPDTPRLQLEQAQRNAEAQLSQARTEWQNAERTLAQALERQRLVVQGLRNDVARARTALAQAEQDSGTAQRLAAEGAVSKQSAEQSQTQLSQARIALRTAEDALRRADEDRTEIIGARSRLETARTALANAQKQGQVAVGLAAAAFAKTTLKAPFAGTVTKWLVHKGDYVAPGTPLATFQDLQDVVLNLPVDETDLPKMRPGGPVQITFDAYPERRFDGRILRIGKASTQAKDVMVFPVDVRFADPQELIKPGMSGDAEILVQERQNTLAVPLAAVKRDKGRYYVEMKRGNKTEEVTFQPGIITLEHVEVLTGLKEGDPVITSSDKAEKK